MIKLIQKLKCFFGFYVVDRWVYFSGDGNNYRLKQHCIKCGGDLVWGQFVTGENICMDCKSLTPLQINQRIAELKGYALNMMMSNPPKWDGYVMLPEERDASKSFKCPNWSENISDAWDLFEEMPLAEIFHTNLKDVKYTVTIWVRSKHTE